MNGKNRKAVSTGEVTTLLINELLHPRFTFATNVDMPMSNYLLTGMIGTESSVHSDSRRNL